MKATLVLLLAAAAAPAVAAETLVIRGATVVDTVGARDLADATIVVRNGRIAAVGRNLRIPRGARIVDARGKYLIPGLIDGHVHFFQSGGLHTRPDAIDLRSEVPYAEELAAIRRRLPDTLSLYTRLGVTGAVDMGGPFWNFEVRDLAARRADAPRVWVAGPLLSPFQPAELVTADPPILRIDTVGQAREQARAQVARKPDFLKFWYIVGQGGPAEARPRLAAMIGEGRRARIPSAVHATQLETARAAVAEGASVLVHSVDDKEVDDAFVAAVKKSGAVYIPTLTVMFGYGDVYGRRNPLDPAERAGGQSEVVRSFDKLADLKLPSWAPQASAQIAATLPVMQRNLIRMYRAGVPIVMGTDAGNIGTLHASSVPSEMKAMETAGMPPRAVLASATIAAARMLGAERDLGSIERGKVADLVLLREDPRRDISAVAAVDAVVRNGRMLDGPGAAEALVQRQVDAYNAWDLEAFASTYAEDIALYGLDLGAGTPLDSGIVQLRKEYGDFFKAKPRAEIVQRIVMAPFVADLERLDIGGRKLEAAAVYLVEQGRIRRVWFANAALKDGDPANAAAVVDRARASAAAGRRAEFLAAHADGHSFHRLAADGAPPAPQPASMPARPLARIQAGPFVIDHDRTERDTLTIRLVKDGKIARTWEAQARQGP